MYTINDLSSTIIGAAIEVHRALGPGLLESAYEQCLARELSLRNIPFQQQKSLPVHYKGTQLDCGYRLDFLVADMVVVEVKAHRRTAAYPSSPVAQLSQAWRMEARATHQFSRSFIEGRH
jgi:GxxExxY protein